MTDVVIEVPDRRAEIAYRNRRRQLESRDYKVMMATFGILAFSAFSNGAAGTMQLLGGSQLLLDAIIGMALGALYAFGAYRVWIKDDLRKWFIILPASISLAMAALVWLFVGLPPVGAIALNIALLVLIPIRAKSSRDLAAMPSNSFKPNPIRGSA
ncbi:hypothetical protein [Pseudoxanthomonas suwonensis]|uniref:hypothetical protein n=1 Tax=Pseudoxanthomonas suwonensis TaxID=314722 RepID=UPI0011851973|nr:hypothetical protein [Pseudoxanthomonas suwonensis]